MVDWLMIIDNSAQMTDIPSILSQNPKVLLYHDGENQGIAVRLNMAANEAVKRNATWMLTMDQDSSFGDGSLPEYFKSISTFPENEQVGMFGITHDEKQQREQPCSENVYTLITSGSVVNLSILRQLQGFDENLFIDEVDTEYCFRVRIAGFKVILFSHICLTHRLGKKEQHISLKNFKATDRTLYPPMRLYYLVRNHLYLKRKYNKLLPQEIKKRRKHLFIYLKNSFLYGKNKHRVIHYVYQAIEDFRGGRMGKKTN